ncbi:MAG: hypothetical protein E7582_03125 [Ruminococcaceae bacterium]|nr:hypothetical protein [Oscillospiraceae bacterium]
MKLKRKEEQLSQDWQLLEKGRDYNRRINLYDTVNKNERFWRGDQWNGVNSGGLPTPVFNIFKRVISYFVSNIMSAKIALKIDAESAGVIYKKEVRDDLVRVSNLLTSYLNYRFEKDNVTSLLYDGVRDAAISGDMFLYVYWDREKKTLQDYTGDFVTKLLDNTNVFFGDVNTTDIQSQPYILISGRDLVENLKEEARQNGISEEDIAKIVSDSDYDTQSGDGAENELADTKCTYVIKLFRKNSTIFYQKSTKSCVITKEIDTRLTLYPLALMNWDKTKNSYHGTAAATGLIENQVYINKAFAMVMKHMINVSFSKVVYNSNLIDEWTNEVGEAIAVNGSIDNVAEVLSPGVMQSGFLDVITLTMNLTRELMGATDAALGNVEATNTSAIIALQESSALPLEIQKRALYSAVEQLGMIWLDYILHYYDRYRMLVWRDEDILRGSMMDVSLYGDVIFSCNVKAGMTGYYSEVASLNTLENLLKNGLITLEQYLERLPEGYIASKEALIEDCRRLEAERKEELNNAKSQRDF